MLNAPKSQPRILPPEGTHIARCIRLIQIGTLETPFGSSNKIQLEWELPEELYEFKQGEGEKPFKVSAKYTLSLADKSNLYPIVEGIVGDIPEDVRDSFDVEELVGKESLITIKHAESKKGSKYALVASTAPLMKSQKAPEAINPLQILTYEKWNKDLFNSLPDFIKDEMKGTPEYKKHFGGTGVEGEEQIDANDVPF